jgi:hypothetical protein
MTTWLEMPELEARVTAADAQPPDLDRLRAAVEAIATALEREVKADGSPPLLTFRNHKGAFYNVKVRHGGYRVLYIHQAAQLEFQHHGTAELAWKICGYKCSPGQMRIAKERARLDGFVGEILPNQYFSAIKRTRK